MVTLVLEIGYNSLCWEPNMLDVPCFQGWTRHDRNLMPKTPYLTNAAAMATNRARSFRFAAHVAFQMGVTQSP